MQEAGSGKKLRTYSSKHNKKRSSKSNPGTYAINPPKDYIFGVLQNLLLDLGDSLDGAITKELTKIIRMRDFNAYLVFIEKIAGLNSFKYWPASPESFEQVCARRFLAIGTSFCFDSGGNDNTCERQRKALDKFFKAEELCCQVNRTGIPRGYPNEDLFEAQIFELARAEISKLLGKPDMRELLNACHFGKGSSLSTREQRTSRLDKYAEVPFSVTPAALPFLRALIYTDDRWLRGLLSYCFPNRGLGSLKTIGPWRYRQRADEICEIMRFGGDLKQLSYGFVTNTGLKDVRKLSPLQYLVTMLSQDDIEYFERTIFKLVLHNRLSYVPKNSLIERIIAIEPAGNLQLQLGLGTMIQRRLRAWSIDITDQVRNKVLACEASLDGRGSTIDLSSASDLISLACAEYFLPREWYKLVQCFRSPYVKIGDEVFRYEKVSSMGNGCTFPLETLIFSALVRAVYKFRGSTWEENIDQTAVYGDDIIVPSQYVNDVMSVLHRTGFRINGAKSFTTGHVRESCGGDYFRGMDVRPVTLRSSPKDVCALYVHYNRIFKTFYERFGYTPKNTLDFLERLVPKHAKFYGPVCEDETGWMFRQTPPPEYTLTFIPEWQTSVWVLTKLQYVREASKIPYELRVCFGALQNDLKGSPPSAFADVTLEKSDRFTPIGRNNRLTIKKTTSRYLNWEATMPRSGD